MSAASAGGLGLGPLTQLAWVVSDLDAAERDLGTVLGAGPWTRLPGVEFGPQACRFRGAPADFVADVSLAYRGDLQLELLRPVRGASLYAEHLARHGPGLHHVCCEVATERELDRVVARAAALGIEVPQSGSMASSGPGSGMRFAYLDLPSASGAAYVEVAWVGDDLRGFFDALRSTP